MRWSPRRFQKPLRILRLLGGCGADAVSDGIEAVEVEYEDGIGGWGRGLLFSRAVLVGEGPRDRDAWGDLDEVGEGREDVDGSMVGYVWLRDICRGTASGETRVERGGDRGFAYGVACGSLVRSLSDDLGVRGWEIARSSGIASKLDPGKEGYV